MTTSAPLGLVLPPEWRTVPLDGGAFEAFVREQRCLLARRGELTRRAQRQFDVILHQLRDDAVTGGVELLAVFATAIDTATGPGLLAATCSLASLTQSTLGTELPITVNTLLAAITRECSPHAVDHVDVMPPGTLELPAGPAVRLVRRPAGDVTGAELLSHHYLVPYAGGRCAALLALATPNLEFSTLIGELFERIAATLRVPVGAPAPVAAR